MKVGELIEELKKFSNNTLVVMQRDPEGNGYSPMSGAEGAKYLKEGRHGEVLNQVDIDAGEYDDATLKEAIDVVVVWPKY